jgi:hypothetical protein
MSEVGGSEGQVPGHDSLATRIDAMTNSAGSLKLKLAAGDDFHLLRRDRYGLYGKKQDQQANQKSPA